eukprot:gnl/TRDRNA2_/TRDRNA2_174497_c2_seq5.p1 gnl/TRDRNA2_/TRDRNA2_174497_c2~~gnl/TRDRNA2_/TRDRNA2_174497_c2_seq5.p1  ORF type:complete len:138 (-),score=27.83 gnl/TRDRNA2_/TRDRNA2_174497_c2_seq5:33-446(-)
MGIWRSHLFLDEKLFRALALAAVQSVNKFNAQELATTAWAFATVGERNEAALAMFVKAPERGKVERPGAPGSFMSGFALLARAEQSGLLSFADNSCYPLLRMLFESCRAIDNPDAASWVRAVMERLCLIARPPAATA